MEDSFNFSKLTKFLHQTLVLTEEVKNVLKSNCDEAMYCLKPWYTEIHSQQEVNKDICTCVKSKDEVQEIAADISRTLIQTQQLREKLSSNITGRKTKYYAYECFQETVGNKKQKKVKSLNISNKDIYSRQGLSGIKLNVEKASIDKGVQNEVTQRDAHMTSKKTKNANKQSISHSMKSSESKNFLVINKKNIKNITVVKDINRKMKNDVKSNTSITESKCIKFSQRNSAASTSELKCLIWKMSIKSDNCTLPNEYRMKCPLHEDTISQRTCGQNLTLRTIVDSLNTIDIPEEIIKSLRVYHTYLNTECTERSFNEKQQKVLHTFLLEFNKMDEIAQNQLAHKSYIVTALLKFISLFQTLSSKNIGIDVEDIRSLYTKLRSAWKIYEMNEFKNKQILRNDICKTLHTISNITECMSNGLWNLLYNQNLEGISKICCTRYTNKDQLLLFFDVVQQVQHIQYYDDLMKIIAEDVLPNMNIFLDCTQLEYVKIYKMISILYQGLNSKIPILVRTDK
ncbi:uncharacterized protein [Bombus flavifrons]|uniref:uncharacterized protein isoform X2 n=1 Tax=Bombus flavifrons TaxID=103934 RepID=UPI003703E24A